MYEFGRVGVVMDIDRDALAFLEAQERAPEIDHCRG
jgi:hypothetical protein